LPAHLGMPGSVCATRTVGVWRTTLQDLLAEEITALSRASCGFPVQRRAPQAWSFVADVLGDLRGADYEDAAIRQRNRGRVESGDHRSRPVSWRASARRQGRSGAGRTYPPLHRSWRGSAPSILNTDRTSAWRSPPKASHFYMQECAESATTWLEMIDEFEGVEQVPLMDRAQEQRPGIRHDIIRGSRRQNVGGAISWRL